MIIVSQDKKVILNFNNITELQTEERIKNMDGEKDIMIEAVGNLGNTFILAYYETEERAKEVLQEISVAYANIELLKLDKFNLEETLTSKQISEIIRYEMPEE